MSELTKVFIVACSVGIAVILGMVTYGFLYFYLVPLAIGLSMSAYEWFSTKHPHKDDIFMKYYITAFFIPVLNAVFLLTVAYIYIHSYLMDRKTIRKLKELREEEDEKLRKIRDKHKALIEKTFGKKLVSFEGVANEFGELGYGCIFEGGEKTVINLNDVADIYS